MCVCLWTVPRSRVESRVSLSVGESTAFSPAVNNWFSSWFRCFYHHVVDDALLMCVFFTDTSGSISTVSGLASMSSTFNQDVSCCAAKSSVTLDDVNTVAARFLNLNVRSFHDAAAESKLDNIETARDSMKDMGSIDPTAQVPLTSPLPLLRSYSRCLTSLTIEPATPSLLQ